MTLYSVYLPLNHHIAKYRHFRANYYIAVSRSCSVEQNVMNFSMFCTGTPVVPHKNLPDIVLNGTDSPLNVGTPQSMRRMAFTPKPSGLVKDSTSVKSSIVSASY